MIPSINQGSSQIFYVSYIYVFVKSRTSHHCLEICPNQRGAHYLGSSQGCFILPRKGIMFTIPCFLLHIKECHLLHFVSLFSLESKTQVDFKILLQQQHLTWTLGLFPHFLCAVTTKFFLQLSTSSRIRIVSFKYNDIFPISKEVFNIIIPLYFLENH